MSYLAVKTVHLCCVALSFTLFFLRGVWRLHDSPRMQQRWVRIVPHTIDTVLLISALALAAMLGLSPLDTPWLLAKIIALLVYIVLGSIALKRGKTQRIRLAAWLSAQAVFAYIVATALAHDPMPWRALGD